MKSILKLTTRNEDLPHAQEKMEVGQKEAMPQPLEHRGAEPGSWGTLVHTFGIYQEQKQHWLKNMSLIFFFFFMSPTFSLLASAAMAPQGQGPPGEAPAG